MIVCCPKCGTRFAVAEPGNYVCQCGAKFFAAENGETFPVLEKQNDSGSFAEVQPAPAKVFSAVANAEWAQKPFFVRHAKAIALSLPCIISLFLLIVIIVDLCSTPGWFRGMEAEAAVSLIIVTLLTALCPVFHAKLLREEDTRNTRILYISSLCPLMWELIFPLLQLLFPFECIWWGNKVAETIWNIWMVVYLLSVTSHLILYFVLKHKKMPLWQFLLGYFVHILISGGAIIAAIAPLF